MREAREGEQGHGRGWPGRTPQGVVLGEGVQQHLAERCEARCHMVRTVREGNDVSRGILYKIEEPRCEKGKPERRRLQQYRLGSCIQKDIISCKDAGVGYIMLESLALLLQPDHLDTQ